MTQTTNTGTGSVAVPSSRGDSKARLVRELGLAPHPEGGYYRETYRDTASVTRADGAVRAASTAIYYLLSDDSYSAWHRIRADEAWHFHAGCPIDIHVLDANGGAWTVRLGNSLEHPGAVFQAVVPAGAWFAAERIGTAADDGQVGQDCPGADFSLAGCTVAPGFEFSEFELASVDALLKDYPDHAALIRRLAPRSR
jgi:predicted cupin superfamily sugar epimerase